jgi:hypothetical protein
VGHRVAVRHIRAQTGNAEVLFSQCCGPPTTQLKITAWRRRGKMLRSANAHWPRSYTTG